jgi:hypothetical protein
MSAKVILPLTPESLSSRAKRRKALEVILEELEKIRYAEEAYQERIPMNLQNSCAYYSAEDCVSIITDGIIFLSDAFYQ